MTAINEIDWAIFTWCHGKKSTVLYRNDCRFFQSWKQQNVNIVIFTIKKNCLQIEEKNAISNEKKKTYINRWKHKSLRHCFVGYVQHTKVLAHDEHWNRTWKTTNVFESNETHYDLKNWLSTWTEFHNDFKSESVFMACGNE